MKFITVNPHDGADIHAYEITDNESFDVVMAINMALDNDPSTPEFRAAILDSLGDLNNKWGLSSWLAALAQIYYPGDHPGQINYRLEDYIDELRIYSFIMENSVTVARFDRSVDVITHDAVHDELSTSTDYELEVNAECDAPQPSECCATTEPHEDESVKQNTDVNQEECLQTIQKSTSTE